MNKIIMILVDNSEKEVASVDGIQIIWCGANNVVKVHENTKFTNCVFEVGNDNEISFGSGGLVMNLHIRMRAYSSKVDVGDNFIISRGKFRLADEHKNQSIVIGKDCLFSSDIGIFTADGHTLIDNDTGAVLNDKNGSIKIGNHVWIGHGVCILKNVHIGDNCVIGARSLVTKDFYDNNLLIAGHPSKVIRKNINWSIKRPDDYKKEQDETIKNGM